MTKRLGICIIFITAISCSVPKTANNVGDKNVDKVFSKEDPLIIKGMDGKAQIYGKDKDGQFNIYPPTVFSIFKNKNYEAIIEYGKDFLPNLITFDTLTLKNIDKLQLINYSRNWRPDYALFEEVRIYDESKIVLIDSVFSYHVDDNGKRIDDSKKVSVYSERYKIDDNGKIIKIEN